MNEERAFRQKDADELHAVTGAIFGSWERNPEDGSSVRVPGVLERLTRIERAIQRSIGLAAATGATTGAIIGAVVEHAIEALLKIH